MGVEESATLVDRAVTSEEFWVSTVVDIVVSLAVGVAAAAIVGAAIAGLAAIGFTAVTTLPLWATVGATAVAGIALGLGVDALGIPEGMKDWANGLFS